MRKHVQYIDFDEEGVVKRVGCMKCNDTVAEQATRSNGDKYLKHMSHSRAFPVHLSNGTTADIIICAKCHHNILDEDLKYLEQAMHWGWMRECVESTAPNHKVRNVGNFAKNAKILRRI